MPRFQTDDDFYDDPAVIQAGTSAMGLYYLCGVYVARHLLDGVVPSEVAVRLGTPEWRNKLLAAGLWVTGPGGRFVMPLYFKHGNPTRARVLAEREAKSLRQQRWLEGKRRVSRHANNPSHDATQDGSKDDALPLSFTGKKGRARGSGAGAPRTAETKPKPPWCGVCDERTRLTDDDTPRYCPDCHPLREDE
jgi:hypothetical protein